MDNDDVPIDEENGRRVAETVAATSATAAEMVREHEAEHGEILPTLLLDDVGSWFARSRATDAEAVRAVEAAGALYEHGDDDIQTIVATGLLEAMPQPHQEGREVVERLPAPLREELRRMENPAPP